MPPETLLVMLTSSGGHLAVTELAAAQGRKEAAGLPPLHSAPQTQKE